MRFIRLFKEMEDRIGEAHGGVLTIRLDMGNAAFENSADEVAAILGDLSRTLVAKGSVEVGDNGALKDVNGNTVGEWKVEDGSVGG